jgi:hypothetical protein
MTDALLNYPCGVPRWTCLQFRDGRLVNFDPDQFKRYEPASCCLAAPTTGPAANTSHET